MIHGEALNIEEQILKQRQHFLKWWFRKKLHFRGRNWVHHTQAWILRQQVRAKQQTWRWGGSLQSGDDLKGCNMSAATVVTLQFSALALTHRIYTARQVPQSSIKGTGASQIHQETWPMSQRPSHTQIIDARLLYLPLQQISAVPVEKCAPSRVSIPLTPQCDRQ